MYKKGLFICSSLFNNHCLNIIIITLTGHYYNLNFESATAMVFVSHSMFSFYKSYS